MHHGIWNRSLFLLALQPEFGGAYYLALGESCFALFTEESMRLRCINDLARSQDVLNFKPI